MPGRGKNRRFSHVPEQLKELTTSVDHTPFHADSRFEDFPSPPGVPPFHMDLSDLLQQAEIDQIVKDKKFVFHTTGDTGNFKNNLQLDVAQLLRDDLKAS